MDGSKVAETSRTVVLEDKNCVLLRILIWCYAYFDMPVVSVTANHIHFSQLKKKNKWKFFIFFLNCSQITFTHALCYEEAAKSDNTLPAWIKAFSGFFKK